MLIGRSYYLLILVATLVFFAWLLYQSATGIDGIPQQAAAGKKVFQDRSCIQCHSIFGNGGYYGGDLTRVYDRLGEEQLKAWLVDPPLFVGASRKKHMSLPLIEANDITRYLQYISTIDTGNWPPQTNRE